MIEFQKLHGLGNDFIIINGINKEIGNLNDLAKKVCNRNFGIGSDGMIIVKESQIADIKMLFYNADGSQAPMCGNGIRCFAKFVYDNKILNKISFTVETLGGIMKPEVFIDDLKVKSVTVNLGKPIYSSKLIPVLSENDTFIDEEIEVENNKYNISAVIIGSVHAIIFTPNLESIDIEKIGPIIEKHKIFPEKINVNFCKIIDNNNIEVLTWERGVGKTLACGTGASAAAIIANKLYNLNNIINVHLLGGSVTIETIDREVYMNGPAELICSGVYYL